MAPVEPTAESAPDTLLGVLNAFGGGDSFAVSFLFGGVVIALYAGKRLGDLISPPKDEEYDFTRMLSLSTMVGRDVFYRAYIFYLFLLEFFYFILCSFQPLKDILQGQSSTITFGGATWPLGAALLVVGVLPATPVVVQIEQSLRRFAHNMANIPDEFYNRVTALSTQDIETLASQSHEYDSEVEFFWRVTNILIVLGYDLDEAARKARKCVSLRLFGEWTLDRKELWSQSEYEKYRDVVELLRPRFEALKLQLSQIIAETESSDFMTSVMKRNCGIDLAAKPDHAQTEALRVDAEGILSGLPASSGYAIPPADVDAFKQLRDNWGKLTKECEVAAKRLIALFSIIARNDKRTLRELERPINASTLASHGIVSTDKRFNDPVLRAFARLIRSVGPTSEPWYNSILLSVLSIFVITTVVASLYRIGTENPFFQRLVGISPNFSGIDTLIRGAVIKSLIDAFFIALACWFASVTALFIRSSKLRDEEWLTFYDFKTIPISSYGGVFFASLAASFPALVLQYVSFYKVSGQTTRADNMLEVMATNLGISISFGLYAVGLCVLTDIISLNKCRNYFWLCFTVSFPAILFNFFVLVVSPGYLGSIVYFLNQNLIYIATCYGGILIYGKGLQSRMNSSRVAYSGPDRRSDLSREDGASGI